MQQTDTASRQSDAASQPTNAASQPTNAASQPTNAASQQTNAASQQPSTPAIAPDEASYLAKRRLRAGVIGLGFMGRHHIVQLEKLPQVELVAVADKEPARRHNKATISGNISLPSPDTDFSTLQVFDDGQELIRQADVDFVDVCAPSYLHAELAVLAAEGGRHIITEKPMALTSADADRMIAAARHNCVELMVAQCVRFWPEYVYLRETVDAGRLGRLLRADFARRSAQPVWSWQGWMNDARRSGGAIFDLHIHDVDFVNHLLGLPAQVYATGVRTAASGGYDLISAIFTYDKGPAVSIDAGWYLTPAYRFNSSFQAVFEEGIVRYDGMSRPTLSIFYNDRAEPDIPTLSGDPYFLELAYFIGRLAAAERGLSAHPPESSRQSVYLVECEIASIESGVTVDPRSFDTL
jgi:predicted dehydrogenase